MKKLFAILMALVLAFSMSAVAFADAADELVHAGALPTESSQEVKITINGLTDGSGSDPDNRLPSEYHVRVIWDVTNGQYSATKTDSAENGGFQNFLWNCEVLDFEVNEVASGENGDIREGNWVSKPAVAFEVTNASTPDLPIYAAASLKGDDAWAQFLNATSIADQNTAIGTQTVAPVLKANLGTGVDSYELNQGADSHNVYAYEYELNWNYNALNAAALAAYKAGSGAVDYANTFVVTVSAVSGN